MDGRPCCHPCARIVTKGPSAIALSLHSGASRTLASKLREPAELGPERLGGSSGAGKKVEDRVSRGGGVRNRKRGGRDGKEAGAGRRGHGRDK